MCDWIDCSIRIGFLPPTSTIWKCEIKVKDATGSCTGDATAYAEVDNKAVVKIKTDTIYDKELCTRCKIDNSWLQSEF